MKNQIPKPTLLPDEIRTELASMIDVLVDPDPSGKVFCFMDNLITLRLFDKKLEAVDSCNPIDHRCY